MNIVNHNANNSNEILKKVSGEFKLRGQEIADLFDGEIAERNKTSLRMHYEAQAEVIKKQIGNLEEIREKIGLSQRKICQLLLVDPSAWSRWMKTRATPPHILRALQWYLIIQEKIPGLTPQYFIGKDPQVLHQQALKKISEESQKRSEMLENFFTQTLKLEDEIQDLQSKNSELKKDQSHLKRRLNQLKNLTLLLSFLLILVGIFALFR